MFLEPLTAQNAQPLKKLDPEYEVSSAYDCAEAGVAQENR